LSLARPRIPRLPVARKWLSESRRRLNHDLLCSGSRSAEEEEEEEEERNDRSGGGMASMKLI
jgi:hypothetical protein